jgi:hypothetical protein
MFHLRVISPINHGRSVSGMENNAAISFSNVTRRFGKVTAVDRLTR